eukprot:1505619-Pyramimonas_sp.AAC.1
MPPAGSTAARARPGHHGGGGGTGSGGGGHGGAAVASGSPASTHPRWTLGPQEGRKTLKPSNSRKKRALRTHC